MTKNKIIGCMKLKRKLIQRKYRKINREREKKATSYMSYKLLIMSLDDWTVDSKTGIPESKTLVVESDKQ